MLSYNVTVLLDYINGLYIYVCIQHLAIPGKHKKTSKEREGRVTLVHYYQLECENSLRSVVLISIHP